MKLSQDRQLSDNEADNEDDNEDDAMVQYLLGKLPDEWRAQFEERLFTSQECFDKLLLTEDRLIEAYLRGTLGEGERRRFEEQFLASPRRRQRMTTMAAMIRALTDEPGLSATSTKFTSHRSSERKAAWLPAAGYQWIFSLGLLILFGLLTLIALLAWLR